MTYKVYLDKNTDVDALWESLEIKGATPLYAEEEGEDTCLIIQMSNLDILQGLLGIRSVEPHALPEIDWTNQWEEHAPGYTDGKIIIDLATYGGPPTQLSLNPGPGFGDLSHPTTRLALRQLLAIAPGREVVDIGCGSGVLLLCALAAGASSGIGIDICLLALSHAKENALLNDWGKISFCLPEDFMPVKENPVIVMNMILSEQKEAWASLPGLHYLKGTLIVSGILTESEAEALRQYEKWGFHFPQITREDEWSCFTFSGEPA